jgi:hypothetical protein
MTALAEEKVGESNPEKAVREALFSLATYLIGSARDCLEEPLIYGPLRMIVGVERLIEIGNLSPTLRDPFLASKKDSIGKETLSVMSDRDAFAKTLDGLLLEFMEELKRRGRRGPKDLEQESK